MKEKILSIMEEVRPDIDFKNEKGLISEELLESFDLISIIALLQEEMDIEIDNKYITTENFDTLDAIVNLVESIKND